MTLATHQLENNHNQYCMVNGILNLLAIVHPLVALLLNQI